VSGNPRLTSMGKKFERQDKTVNERGEGWGGDHGTETREEHLRVADRRARETNSRGYQMHQRLERVSGRRATIASFALWYREGIT